MATGRDKFLAKLYYNVVTKSFCHFNTRVDSGDTLMFIGLSVKYHEHICKPQLILLKKKLIILQ